MIVITTGCTKYAQYVILLRGTNPGYSSNLFTQPLKINQPHILGSCKTSTFNQIYITSFSQHTRLKTELMVQEKDNINFNINMKNNVYMDDTVKTNYQSCVHVRKYNAHLAGVIFSQKCKVVKSRQLHMYSTCVLNDTESKLACFKQIV